MIKSFQHIPILLTLNLLFSCADVSNQSILEGEILKPVDKVVNITFRDQNFTDTLD